MKKLVQLSCLFLLGLIVLSCETEITEPDTPVNSTPPIAVVNPPATVTPPPAVVTPPPAVTPTPAVTPPANSGTQTDNSVDFSLASDINMNLKLSDYRDNVVVLFFFGNGCSSCKATSPSIQKTFVTDYTGKKVQVIGLDTWDGNLASVKSFKNLSNLTFPLLLEASGVAKTLGTTYDRLMVIDKKGVVRFKGAQLARNDINNAKKVVDEYLK